MKIIQFLISMQLLTLGVASAKPKANFTFLDNGTICIGVDQARGSAIGYFALSKEKRNLLNYHDEGRFIQQ